MERREFLKTSILATGALAGSNLLASQNQTKTFLITMDYNANFESANEIKLYTPLPMLVDNQKISNFKINGNFTSHKVTTIENAPLLFTTYDKKGWDSKKLSLSFLLELSPYQGKKDTTFNDSFLKQTRYVRTDGSIQEIANKAKNLSAEKKLDFFTRFINKNISVEQKEFSNSIKTIRDKQGNFILSGENISANSILVALCRSANIPAKEVFGFNIINNKLIATNQAEVLINQYWKRIDIAQNNIYDFIALNHLRDDYVGDIYTSSAHQTLGSIDGNNLKYYKDFSEKITLKQIA